MHEVSILKEKGVYVDLPRKMLGSVFFDSQTRTAVLTMKRNGEELEYQCMTYAHVRRLSADCVWIEGITQNDDGTCQKQEWRVKFMAEQVCLVSN